MAVNPQGMSLRDWADSAILTLNDAWSLPKLDDEARWQDWAASFAIIPGVSQRSLPDPYQFTDWRDWAMRVYPLLEVF